MRSKKYFSTFFKTLEHFCILMSLYIWREKYFFKSSNKILLTVKKFFKLFDKFRIDKFFLLMYNSPVNIRHKNDSPLMLQVSAPFSERNGQLRELFLRCRFPTFACVWQAADIGRVNRRRKGKLPSRSDGQRVF